MSAIRLLDDQGQTIGTMILDRKALENEIVNGTPELRLAYTTSLTNVLAFTLEVIPPPSSRPTPDVLWDDQKGIVDGQRTV